MNDVPVIYSNRVLVYTRPFDLVIDFMRLIPVAGSGGGTRSPAFRWRRPT